jgi:hypothetical protein
MNLLDMHSENEKVNVKAFGRPVTLTEPGGDVYENLMGIWNDVEHAIKMDDLVNPMGAKSSIYFDTDTLFNLGIAPTMGWKLTGSPNKYDPVKEYFLEIPKIDRQLPGQLFFLSEKKTENTAWNEVTN